LQFLKIDAGRQLSRSVDRVDKNEKAAGWQTALLKQRVEQRLF
jgi:hypothetical protein